MSQLNSNATPYRQFPMRLTAEMFDELDRVSKQTRINKTTISRIALQKFIFELEQSGVDELIDRVCAI